MTDSEFQEHFQTLTGHDPFPWQRKLFERFVSAGTDGIPDVANLPTGLGKTSVIAVWLLALMRMPGRLPRRLVYVVNRRTVVDQTTAEVTRYRRAVSALDAKHPLRVMIERLGISTLRGQFADNQEWSADPSRPAVICGTVDMIGSRLLFAGYRIGFKSRPLHAGLLGQDALLVHDEAHLEPAFQKLIESVKKEQHDFEKVNELPWPRLHVMALSATARTHSDGGASFGLAADESDHPVVAQRLRATKALHLHACKDKSKLAEQVVDLAIKHDGADAAILIFVRRVDDVTEVVNALTAPKKGNVPSDHVETLTGTMRGYERDELVTSNAAFARFMPAGDRPESITPTGGTVYLVCTSAGEVGVNLSADHMVCDLSTFDSTAQRLGRVNRFGDRDDTRVDVVHPAPKAFDDKHKLTAALKSTLALLKQLKGNASPEALGELPAERRLAAYAPEPAILPATGILFDAWALTTIKDTMPGRPAVAPYLHGVADWEPPRTSVAWREEVERIDSALIENHGSDFPRELLADYPLKPHELLSDRSDRVLETLQALAVAQPEAPAWVVDDQGQVRVATLGQIADPSATKAPDKRLLERAIADSVVLLPPAVGGLSGGMLNANGGSDRTEDVADQWLHEDGGSRRTRVWDDTPAPTYEYKGQARPMALIRTIDTHPLADESGVADGEAGESSTRRRFWHWYVRPGDAEDATRASARPITWDHHTEDVVQRTRHIVADLDLPTDLERSIVLAAELHDLGKKREIWQRSIGNPNPTDWHAKPGNPIEGPPWKPRRLSGYRHELGSLLDSIAKEKEHAATLAALGDEMRDVVLHLVAAHHGYARPHFPLGAYDHERYTNEDNERAVQNVMRRYVRLQRRYGRWGLAYLESLLRAADWAASANPSEPTSGNGAAS